MRNDAFGDKIWVSCFCGPCPAEAVTDNRLPKERPLADLTRLHPILLLPMALLLFSVVYLYILHRGCRAESPAAPDARELQRRPGQSLLIKMNRIRHRIHIYIGLLVLIPVMFGGGYAAVRGGVPRPIPLPELALASLLAAILWSYALYQLTGLILRWRHVKSGYQNEVEVGTQLHRLLNDGCHVIHDVPADQFNISHVVIGQKGVFAVNTPARSKPASRGRKEAPIVEYNGKVLYFPNEKDLETVETAELRANWLSEWIGRTAGQPVAVRAMVAVPGWTVKRTSADGIPVVNPQQFPSLFAHIHPRPLSAESVACIVRQLESHCRTTDCPPSA